MSKNVTEKNEPANLDDDKSGSRPPPVKNRSGEGQTENPFGRRRPKAQRNLPAVLTEVLSQTVLIKQGDKSERMTKGDAVIKKLMSMAQNGDHRAIAAISTLAEKIGRVDDNINSKTGGRIGIMLVPGTATPEEWNEMMTERRRQNAEKDAQTEREIQLIMEKNNKARMQLAQDAVKATQSPPKPAKRVVTPEEYATLPFSQRGGVIEEGAARLEEERLAALGIEL
jgi:hypothetical protein